MSAEPGLDVVIRNYDKIVELVKEILKRRGFRDKEIYLFQSRVTGTHRPNSDIDIYVQLEEEHRPLLEEKGVDYNGVKVLENNTLLEGYDDLRKRFIIEDSIFLDVKVGMAETPPSKPWYETLHYVKLRELAP